MHTNLPKMPGIIDLDRWTRKKPSSITFKTSRHFQNDRWWPIRHHFGMLVRINRHNLEKYLSCSHSSHWHSIERKNFSTRFFPNIETFREQRLTIWKDRESSIFLSLIRWFFPDPGERATLIFRNTLVIRQRRGEQWRTTETAAGDGLTLWRKARWLRLANRTLGSWLCHRGHLVDFVDLHRRPFTWHGTTNGGTPVVISIFRRELCPLSACCQK